MLCTHCCQVQQAKMFCAIISGCVADAAAVARLKCVDSTWCGATNALGIALLFELLADETRLLITGLERQWP